MAKWINCKDKMPEKDGRYLVIETFPFGSQWRGVSSLRNHKWDCIAVSHWMELPELPDGDNGYG